MKGGNEDTNTHDTNPPEFTNRARGGVSGPSLKDRILSGEISVTQAEAIGWYASKSTKNKWKRAAAKREVVSK